MTRIYPGTKHWRPLKAPVIEAKILADSINTEGIRLVSMELAYPRDVHAEVMTYRNFSRNAASSRAIPTKRFRRDVLRHPARPFKWGMNCPGMASKTTPGPIRTILADAVFGLVLVAAAMGHWVLERIGIHKENANRILEPFCHITVVATAKESDWLRAIAERDSDLAHPNIAALFRAVKVALKESVPALKKVSEWHLPYVTDAEQEAHKEVPSQLRVVCVARCARVSNRSLTHPGSVSTFEEDMALYTKLLKASPPHASPFEHAAAAYPPDMCGGGNFGPRLGWTQLRKDLGI